MPTTDPSISITKSKELLQQRDKLIATFPEVVSVHGKIGRFEKKYSTPATRNALAAADSLAGQDQNNLVMNAGAEFYSHERCYITELLNSESDPDASIARARVHRGVTTRWHRLIGITERYVILEGTARVEIGSLSPRDVGQGEVVVIPPEWRQRITNTGTDETRCILAG